MITLSWVNEWGDEVIVEDDGSVCYAYLLVECTIVSDVWLYNVDPAPESPEWTCSEGFNSGPFLNPRAFVLERDFSPIANEQEVRVFWGEREGRLEAAIHVRGEYLALLREGEKPGYCGLAMHDGPIAKGLIR